MSIGLNILGDRGRSEQELFTAALATGGRTHIVMNNPGLAARLALAGKRVVYRHWPDDNAQDRADPRAFVRERHALAPAGCLIHLTNEPWHQSAAQMTRLAAWTDTALDECDRLGRKAVLFNLPVGNPPDMAVWTHARDVLARAKRDGHLLGLHEYYGADGDTDPLSARHKTWYVGRFERIPAGIELPEILITEFGYCHEMKPRQGYWTRLTNAQYADGLARAARELYAPRGIDACVFCIGSEADDWREFSVRAGVVEGIAAYNRTEAAPPVVVPPPPPVVPPPTTPPEPGLYTPLTSDELRQLAQLHTQIAAIFYAAWERLYAP